MSVQNILDSAKAAISQLLSAHKPVTLVKCNSTAQLMQALTDVSQAYVQVINNYVNSARLEPLQHDVTGAVSDLQNMFLEQVAFDRLQILLHENNIFHARGYGASNTIYSSPDRTLTAPAEFLNSVKVLLTKRAGQDGIGPFGGLLEMLDKIFTDFIFDQEAFNKLDESLIALLTEDITRKEELYSKLHATDQSLSSRWSFRKEADLATLEASKLLLALHNAKSSLNDKGALAQEIKKYLDDTRIDANGDLVIETDPNKIADNAADRELVEESTLAGKKAQTLLQQMLKHPVVRKIILGGKLDNGDDSQIMDLNFILREFNVKQFKAVAQAVGPIMSITEVRPEDLEAFRQAYEENKAKKGTDEYSSLLQPSSHMEVSELLFSGLDVLRRSSGFTTEFGGEVDTSIAISKNKAKFGEWAYRYAHEGFVALVLTMILLHEVIKDKGEFHDFLVAQAKQDQKDVYIKDNHNLELSILSKAKVMFPTALPLIEGEEAKKEAAYNITVNEILGHNPQLGDVLDSDLLKDIDNAYGDTHNLIQAMGGDAAAAYAFA